MRWSLTLSAAIIIGIPVFTIPVPSIPDFSGKRGLFQQTLQLANTTPDEVAVLITNALTDDPGPCPKVKTLFEQIAEGESANGVTTIGDRAVAGARKMLNLESAGTAGLLQMFDDLKSGTISNQTRVALIQTFTNTQRTISSLETYKYMFDSRASLGNLTDAIVALNGTEDLTPMNDIVNQMQPALEELETAIDAFGAAFSVQNIGNQTAEIANIMSLVSDAFSKMPDLYSLNKNGSQDILSLINDANNNLSLLQSSASTASTLANEAPELDPEQFTGRPGTACS